MEYDYGKLESVPDDVFQKAGAESAPHLIDATVCDEEDIRRMERLLDLRQGVLEGSTLRLQKANCGSCGRLLTFYDLVYTAIVDAGHPKSFVVHTLIGSKRILNKRRKIRCSTCNTVSDGEHVYWGEDYGCSY